MYRKYASFHYFAVYDFPGSIMTVYSMYRNWYMQHNFWRLTLEKKKLCGFFV